MTQSASETVDVTLTAYAYGGEALGRLPDGRAVFVPYALPGEAVRIRLLEEKRGHARAALVEVLVPSPERVQPRCPHFMVCGGCHYQHMSYPAQLAAKKDILRSQLERLGGLKDPPVHPAIPSPQPWNYRNHIQFHLTQQGELGYQAARSNQVIPIRECHLPEEAINSVWPQLEVEVLPGLERISLRQGVDEEILLILESSSSQPLEFTVEELPLSAVLLGPGGRLVLAGSDHLVMEVDGRLFRVSAESFFQVNTQMVAEMLKHLLENMPLSSDSTVLDVYCGVGLFSAFLAARVGRLIGIEVSSPACEDFVVNLDVYNNVELYEGTAEDILPGLDVHPDVMVVDPPRSGLAPRVTDRILSMGVPFLAYVSCDPSILSRDARRLVEGGYQLVQVMPFDLFPQTYHIESISLFGR